MLPSQQPDRAPRRLRDLSSKRVIGGVAALVVVLVGAPWFYIHVVEGKAPAKLTLDTATSSAAPARAGSLNGTWAVAAESVAGYRVKETLFGQKADAVGRTNDVTGDVTVEGNTVTGAKFEVDMTTVKSDRNQRDNQFQGRIMDTSSFPKATFTSTDPIGVPAEAVAGKQFTAKATGDLTLHGKTKSVAFTVTGQKSAAGFDVTAQIPIVFADFGIDNPSFGPAQTGDDGVLEVLLKLAPKA
ncbi:MAG: YceI family protein [Actinomycetota bacterium]